MATLRILDPSLQGYLASATDVVLDQLVAQTPTTAVFTARRLGTDDDGTDITGWRYVYGAVPGTFFTGGGGEPLAGEIGTLRVYNGPEADGQLLYEVTNLGLDLAAFFAGTGEDPSAFERVVFSGSDTVQVDGPGIDSSVVERTTPTTPETPDVLQGDAGIFETVTLPGRIGGYVRSGNPGEFTLVRVDDGFTLTLRDIDRLFFAGQELQIDVVDYFARSAEAEDDPGADADPDALTVAEGLPSGNLVDVLLANDRALDQGRTLSIQSVEGGGERVSFEAEAQTIVYTASGFEQLAVGETATDAFAYTVVAGGGGTDTANVSLTVAGANDAPQIDAGASETTGTVPEIADGAAGEGAQILTVAGSIAFSDVDLSDTHQAVAVADGPGFRGSFMLEGTPTTTGTTTEGTQNWRFMIDDAQLEDLGPGETLTQTYTITIEDGNGGSAEVPVTITLEGAADAPEPGNDPDADTGLPDLGAAEDAPTSFPAAGLLDNDSTPDANAELSVTAVDDPDGPEAGGTVTLDGTTITFDPLGAFEDLGVGQTRSETFGYTVESSVDGEASALFTVTVIGANDDPVAGPDEESAAAGDILTIPADQLLANDTDVDGDTLTVTAATPTPGTVGTVAFAEGTVTYTASGFELGPEGTATDSFEYTVSDGNGGEDTGTVTVTVTLTAVEIETGDDLAATDADVALEIAAAVLLQNDGEAGEGLTLTAVAPAAAGTNGTVTLEGETVVYTPGPTFVPLAEGAEQTDQFTYDVVDAAGNTGTATVTVTVTGVNDDPVAITDGPFETPADSPLTLEAATLLANDSDPDTGDEIALSAVDGADTQGTVTLSEGVITYDPSGAFPELLAGQTATDSFTYTVEDADGATDTATVTVEVTGLAGTPPIAEDDAFTIDELGILAGNLLADNGSGVDLDPAGGDLTVVETNLPGGVGTIDVNPDGTFTYDPQVGPLGAGDSDTVTFTYTVANGAGQQSAPATVTISVTGIDEAPVALDDAFAAPEGVEITGDLFADNGSGADFDPDGDTFTVDDFTFGGDVAVTVAPDGTFVFNSLDLDLATGQTQTFTGTYTLIDEDGLTSDPATITVTVTGQNEPPVALDDAFAVDELTVLNANLFADNGSGVDFDPDDQAFTVDEIANFTGIGTLDVLANGDVTYTPTGFTLGDGQTGTETFEYTIEDEDGEVSETALVTITINGVDEPPVPLDDTFFATEGVELTADLFADNGSGADFDPDGDGFDILEVIGTLPGFFDVSPEGLLTYIPEIPGLDAGEQATVTFEYRIEDDDDLPSDPAAPALVTVVVDGRDEIVTTQDDVVDLTDGLVSLREAVQSSNLDPDEDTIGFDPAVFSGGAASIISLTQGEIEVTAPVILDGTGATDLVITGDAGGDDPLTTVDGIAVTDIVAGAGTLDDNSRILNATTAGATVGLQSLALTGGFANDAGGGAVRAFADVSLSDVLIAGNGTGDPISPSPDLPGGAIYSLATVTADAATVVGNRTAGPTSEGGAIYAEDVVVTGSDFRSNVTEGAGSSGGAIFAFDTADISGTAFTENGTLGGSSRGGALFSFNDATVDASTFDGNMTEGSESSGGAIYTTADISVSDTDLSGNRTLGTDSEGGAIFAQNVDLTGGTVADNSTFADRSEAGAIFGRGTVTITNATVSGNSTSGQLSEGGAIQGVAGVTIVNSTITNNQTFGPDSPGGAVFGDSAVTVTGSTVDGNGTAGAEAGGGAIYAAGSVTVDTSTIVNNSTQNGFGGGTASPGGGIFGAGLTGTVTITNSTVSGNTANYGSDGGGINSNNPVIITGSVVSDNVSDGSGGGVATTSDVSIADSTVERNSTLGDYSAGGGVRAFGSVTITNTTLALNTTQGDGAAGGAVFTVTGLTSTDSTFDANTTSGDYAPGGAVFSVADVDIDTGTLTNNSTAGYEAPGGAVYSYGIATITDSTLDGNGTVDDLSTGGALYAYVATVERSVISNNTTQGFGADGGGIYAYSGLDLTNSVVSGNTTSGAAANGGGISLYGAGTITGSTITDNAVIQDASSGGGIASLSTGGSLTVVNSTVARNAALERGGGISGEDVTLVNATITSNTATNIGGGGIESFGTLSLTNSIVSGNESGTGTNNEILLPGGFGGLVLGGRNLLGPDFFDDGGIFLAGGFTPEDIFTTTAQVGPDPDDTGGVPEDNGGISVGAPAAQAVLQTVALLDDPLNPALDTSDDGLFQLIFFGTTDNRGQPREVDLADVGIGANVIDLGSFERQSLTNPFGPLVDTAGQDNGLGTIGDDVLVLIDDGQPDSFDAGPGIDLLDLSTPARDNVDSELVAGPSGFTIVDFNGTLTPATQTFTDFEIVIANTAVNQFDELDYSAATLPVVLGDAPGGDVDQVEDPGDLVDIVAQDFGVLVGGAGDDTFFDDTTVLLIRDGAGSDTINIVDFANLRIEADGVAETAYTATVAGADLTFFLDQGTAAATVDLGAILGGGGFVWQGGGFGDQPAASFTGFGAGSQFNVVGTGFGDSIVGADTGTLAIVGDDRFGLNGADGDDTISGGAGVDRILGAEGDDLLTGGGSGDAFVRDYGIGDGFDTLTDFTPGADEFQFAGTSDVAGVAAPSASAALAGSDAGAVAVGSGFTLVRGAADAPDFAPASVAAYLADIDGDGTDAILSPANPAVYYLGVDDGTDTTVFRVDDPAGGAIAAAELTPIAVIEGETTDSLLPGSFVLL